MSGVSTQSQAIALDPRSVFTPGPEPADAAPRRPIPSIRDLRDAVVSYYRDSLSRVALVVTSLVLCYGGGGAMFWFHAEYLGEGGPSISWVYHWLLDSTVGFVALTPALFLLLPLATWLAPRTIGRLSRSAIPAGFALIVGGAFALLTTPGPIAHDLMVGRGTWLADRVTEWIGDPNAPAAPHHHYPWLANVTQQLGFGLPLYVGLAFLSVMLVRMTAARWRAPADL